LNGNEILSDIVVHNKYAQYLGGEQRRETWTEIVMRSAEMDAKKYPELESEIYDVYARYVLPKKVVPSMRKLQFAGKPIELSPNRLYNCAFLNMDNYRAFSETMFLLLGGSGVGYSVQSRHVEKLPSISPPKGTIRYVVQDSIIGWADAVKTLMKAYFLGGPKPRFDLRDIRPKGAHLVTSGGKAPGPVPLGDALTKIERVLEGKAYGEKLLPIEVFDIQCFIAEAVLAGGIRRSATICLFDKSDETMLTAKTGEWWITSPQRAMANISAVLHRGETSKKEFQSIFRRTRASGSGEPGFVWTYDYDYGVNPLMLAA
jgi:ribonucleoside-triphosphate reductase